MTISTWVNRALPRLPGAAKALVEEETKLVIDDFCRESTAWRDMLYGFHITAGDREVTPVVDDGTQAEIVGILRVYFDKKQLTQYSHAPWETSTSYPSGFTTKPGDPGVVYLSTFPVVSHTGKLDTYVYLKPTDSTLYVPTLLEQDYNEYIFDGVMGRMSMQPNKPYTDEKTSAYHLRRFQNGKQIAKDKANRGFTSNAQNWVFPKFGR